MMALGIGGFVILAVIIFVIIGHAAGFLGGGGSRATESEESASESMTITTTTEAPTETVTETEASVEVPDLLGRTESEVRQMLSARKLGINIQKGTSNEYDEGEVYDQSPEAGTTVAEHTQITVYISTGRETFSLDDVSGMDYSQAQSMLENAGLDVDLEFENSDSVSKDRVIRTSPSAGSQVSEGDTVTIIVSEGKRTEYVTVPDVRGYDLDTAISMLEDAGLNYNGKSSDYSDSYDEDLVMDQSISSGNSVEKGTSITVTVSLGPRVRTYTASVAIPSPFGVDVPDSNGENQVYAEGQVRIVVTQDGTSKTVYDQYVTESELPASVETTSESASSGTATLYINGYEFESWTVYFQ